MERSRANRNKETVINIDKELFSGNVLDVGSENYGVVYNLYKHYNSEVEVDYVQGKSEKQIIEKGSYDKCVMLFSFSNIWLKLNKKTYIQDIYDFLKSDGEIHIWDMDKSFLKSFSSKIKLVLPDSTIKEMNIKEYNIFKNASLKSTLKILEHYFEILELKHIDNVYYIRGKKLCNRTGMSYK